MASNKASIEAGRGHVTLSTDKSQLTKGLEEAKASFEAWGKGIATLGASIAAAGASIVAPFAAGLVAFSAWGAEMHSTMRQTGMDFLGLDTLMDGMGASGEEMAAASSKMAIFLNEAGSGAAGANAALQEMGLSLADLQQMSRADQMMAIADGLSKIGDANQRIAMTRQILGKQAGALNLTGGAEGIRARADRSDEIEGQLSESDLQIARAYNKAMRELGMSATGIWRELGATMAPIMTMIYRGITNGQIAVRKFLEENRGLAMIVLLVGGGLMWLGTAIGATSLAFYAAAAACKVLIFALGILKVVAAVASSALAIIPAILFAIVAVGAVIQLAILAVGAAIIGLIVGVVARLLYTRGMLIPIWNGIVATFWDAYETIKVVLGLIYYSTIGWIVDAVRDAWGFLTGFFSSTSVDSTSWLARIGEWFTGSLWPTVQDVLGKVADAFDETWNHATEFLGPLLDQVQQTGAAIKDAIAGGDLTMAWDIAVVSMQLAWARLVGFLESSWITWKYTALDVLDTVGEFLVDTFRSVWTEVRIIAMTVWEQIKGVVYPIISRMLQSTAQALAALPGQGDQAQRLEAAARNLTTAPMSATTIRAFAESDEMASWFARQSAIATRQDELAAARDAEAAGAGDENRQRILDLEGDLGLLTAQAADLAGAGRAVAAIGDEQARGGPNGFVAGAFSAALIAGFLGAAGGSTETRGEREARAARERLDEILVELQRRPGVVMG